VEGGMVRAEQDFLFVCLFVCLSVGGAVAAVAAMTTTTTATTPSFCVCVCVCVLGEGEGEGEGAYIPSHCSVLSYPILSCAFLHFRHGAENKRQRKFIKFTKKYQTKYLGLGLFFFSFFVLFPFPFRFLFFCRNVIYQL
jgi:hypothetical protein